MRVRHIALLAAATAAAAMAQPQPRPDMWAAFAEILARDPELKAHFDNLEPLPVGAAAEPGWDRRGVDTDRLLAARPGGLDGNLLVLAGPPGEFAAELRTGRPVAELVPASWAGILRFGEIDLPPHRSAILFVQALGRDRAVLYRAPRWRQGTTSCFGPIAGVAVYSRSGEAAPADRAALEREVASSFTPSRGEILCERFEGNASAGFSRRRFLPDGRPVLGTSHWETRRAFLRPLPIATWLERDQAGAH